MSETKVNVIKNIITIRRTDVAYLVALVFWVTPNIHMRYLFIFYFNMVEECHGRRDVGKLGISLNCNGVSRFKNKGVAADIQELCRF